ncbi:MAG TPA: FAD:protein FMN transferase [Chthoniobacteraceae bacterium]|jgi:thiamine biosynthesis lipoprotein
MKGAAAIFSAVALLLVLFWKGRPVEDRLLTGKAMGTTWTLAWRGTTPPHLHADVAELLERWEQVLSQWRANSDLSRHNRGEMPTPELARVLRLAEEVRIASGGAFDHRILEKVHAAGFGPAGHGIDLSAIGKGFAVDRVGELLRQRGVRDFVFEFGGEVLAGDGEWDVEIERPGIAARKAERTIKLRGRALATSGNYHQFRPGTSGLKSHLIDPRTGEPMERSPCSVSVLAPDCATADAWATALFILGPNHEAVPPKVEVSWQYGPQGFQPTVLRQEASTN